MHRSARHSSRRPTTQSPPSISRGRWRPNELGMQSLCLRPRTKEGPMGGSSTPGADHKWTAIAGLLALCCAGATPVLRVSPRSSRPRSSRRWRRCQDAACATAWLGTSVSFNAHARSPALGLLLLQVSDDVCFSSSLLALPERCGDHDRGPGPSQATNPGRTIRWPSRWRPDRQILVDLGAGVRAEGHEGGNEVMLYDVGTELDRDKNVGDVMFKAAPGEARRRRGITDVIED